MVQNFNLQLKYNGHMIPLLREYKLKTLIKLNSTVTRKFNFRIFKFGNHYNIANRMVVSR